MSSATISTDGNYRYRLTRGDLNRPAMCFVMLNPSTADAFEDDPTIRRCRDFAEREGYQRLEVVNLFAYRTPQPAELLEADDPIGPDNDQHVMRAAWEANVIVAAWGAPSKRLHALHYLRCSELVPKLARAGAIHCLGKTKKGHPRHPLYLRADTALERLV